jgi:uncharacterized membrane protein YvbJ
MKCPECGMDGLTESSEFCRNCGKSVPPRCVVCGSFNSRQVAFCVKCGGKLTKTFVENTHSNREGHSSRPYVVWEGFPFAWLERRSQTKRQYFVSLLLLVAAFAVYIIFISTRLLREAGFGDTVCFVLFAIPFLVGIILLHWWSGREGALEERKEKGV